MQNTILSGSAHYVHRTDDRWPRAIVGRVAVNRGWHLDRDTQFFADGANGLRGYRLHSFAGDRSLVVNIEERVYLGRELLQLVSPAMAAFVDSGFATDRSPWRKAPNTDAGIGLRIGLPRSPRNVLRLDLAYALVPDPRGKRGLLISFSSGQAF
jgi:hemolysin activation/secretion protein